MTLQLLTGQARANQHLCWVQTQLAALWSWHLKPYMTRVASFVSGNQSCQSNGLWNNKWWPEVAAMCVQSLLEVYGYLTPCAAMGTLLSLGSLCQAAKEVQDQVVLLLKKAMFNKDPEARLVAVRGFLYLILQELRHPAEEDSLHLQVSPAVLDAGLSLCHDVS